MAQSDSLPDEVAAEIAGLDKRLRDLERTPQLTRSSIDDGRLPSKDSAGRIRSILGKQPDGSHGSRVVESPAQPTPSAPVLRAGDAGVVMVRWDGNADGPVPLVHGHLEVVASGPSSPAEVVSTIRDRDGGATSFVADVAGTVSVRLVMVGQDRVTRSEASEVSTVEVELPVDVGDIEAKIEAFSDGELEDAAYDNLMARLGEFLVVNAGQVNANDIVTNSALVAELEAHGITLSAEVTDRRFELSGEGWVLTDTTTGETLASVGVDGDFYATNASLTGTFQTSYPNGAGVTISRGDITYWSQDSDQYEDIIETPYVRFSPIDGEKDRDPVIATRGQNLFMTGGTNLNGERKPVEVDGRLTADEIFLNTPLQAPGVYFDTGERYGQIHPRAGIVLSSNSSQPTGMRRGAASGRTTPLGRMGSETPESLEHYNISGDSWDISPGSVHRVDFSFGAPAPYGNRPVIASPRVSSGYLGWRNARTAMMAVSDEGAGGFKTITRAPSENDGDVRYRIAYTWGWK